MTKYFVLSGYDRKDEIRLILFDPNFQRKTHKHETSINYMSKNENKPSIITIQNAFQFLVASEESLNSLNNRIKISRKENNQKYDKELHKIKMDRFRPNIVISSNGYYSPHFEDDINYF